MAQMTKPAIREIITDFAAEIRTKRDVGAKPQTDVINFRTDYTDKRERKIWQVPIELLRFRKDNGRIASDVLDHECNVGPLNEADDEHQDIIREFLWQKDPEKRTVLRSSILHAGQTDAAIITCDGFLINGNRRKMVMDQLHQEFPEDERFAFMKVVILPGEGDAGGPPTLLEIEKLENRYQLQSDGKSEYYGFDRALSIQRKMKLGLSLEQQLGDDPRYAGLSQKKIKAEVRNCEKKYLKPLECVDRYLRQFGRQGQYRTVSAGMSDKEGRWQAFSDYSDTVARDFENGKKRLKLGIEEDEIGEIEEAAFDIIRLRQLPDLPKAHVVMRSLAKYCRTPEGKKAIKSIARNVEPQLDESDCVDEEGKPLTREEIDAKWSARHKEAIVYNLKKAVLSHEARAEKETPLTLLDTAYKKLTHKDMDLSTVTLGDLPKARKLAGLIKKRADELETESYHLQKNLKKLTKQTK